MAEPHPRHRPALASCSSPAPRAGSARRPRAASRASPVPRWCSSPVARSACARSRGSGSASGGVQLPSPSTCSTRTRPRASASTCSSATGGWTCSSTTPAPPGARASPTAATRTCGARWRSTSTPRCGSTEALLPLLRASAPSAIVNVASTAARVARAGTGAYSASKFALAGWSDALWAEERAHGVHVGLVLPGFISTEGFPQSELTAKPWTRWIVSTPERPPRRSTRPASAAGPSATCRGHTRSPPRSARSPPGSSAACSAGRAAARS